MVYLTNTEGAPSEICSDWITGMPLLWEWDASLTDAIVSEAHGPGHWQLMGLRQGLLGEVEGMVPPSVPPSRGACGRMHVVLHVCVAHRLLCPAVSALTVSALTVSALTMSASQLMDLRQRLVGEDERYTPGCSEITPMHVVMVRREGIGEGMRE